MSITAELVVGVYLLIGVILARAALDHPETSKVIQRAESSRLLLVVFVVFWLPSLIFMLWTWIRDRWHHSRHHR